MATILDTNEIYDSDHRDSCCIAALILHKETPRHRENTELTIEAPYLVITIKLKYGAVIVI